MENAGWLKIDCYLDEAKVADYDAVILPGGCWNPDFLRADKDAQNFTRDMHAAGKPTCGICHGPWVMVSAKMLKGKKATAVWNIQIDLENAGATVIDEPCVVDGNLITARFPYDLPRMIDALVKQLVALKDTLLTSYSHCLSTSLHCSPVHRSGFDPSQKGTELQCRYVQQILAERDRIRIASQVMCGLPWQLLDVSLCFVARGCCLDEPWQTWQF